MVACTRATPHSPCTAPHFHAPHFHQAQESRHFYIGFWFCTSASADPPAQVALMARGRRTVPDVLDDGLIDYSENNVDVVAACNRRFGGIEAVHRSSNGWLHVKIKTDKGIDEVVMELQQDVQQNPSRHSIPVGMWLAVFHLQVALPLPSSWPAFATITSAGFEVEQDGTDKLDVLSGGSAALVTDDAGYTVHRRRLAQDEWKKWERVQCVATSAAEAALIPEQAMRVDSCRCAGHSPWHAWLLSPRHPPYMRCKVRPLRIDSDAVVCLRRALRHYH
eukprot:365593-Chlamydomonas_euryale.AAC.2